MRYHFFTFSIVAVFGSTIPLIGHADTRTFALIVGNNTPPGDQAESLAPLRYADDDAVRSYRFFKHLAAEARLFTVPDSETQSRYPHDTIRAELPTLSNLKRAADAFGRKIEMARHAGKKTVVYIFFSGHGGHTQNGEPTFLLSDGLMTQDVLYRDIVGRLNADFQHLFVDACYAEGVVGARGVFDREVDGQPITVTASDKKKMAGPPETRFPGLGLVVSSSADKESHEWSKIESGVFTHELLSGLAGPADINRDGKIVYSELYAFISAANRGIRDTRGKIDVVVRPPNRNHNASIVDLSDMRDVSFLFGDPSSLRHFVVELDNGERYMEANLGSITYAHIALPGSGTAYLRTRDREATFELGKGLLFDFGKLSFSSIDRHAKGSTETALSKGLFQAAYSVDYYHGFIDISGILSVSFEAEPLVLEMNLQNDANRTNRLRRGFAVSAFVLAGTAAVASVVCGSLSLSAKKDFGETDFQRSATEANQKYVRFGTAAWISAAFVPVGVVAGLLLRPRKSKHSKPTRIGRLLFRVPAPTVFDVRF